MSKPWRVGDIVALVPREGSINGSGDGILWEVYKLKNHGKRPRIDTEDFVTLWVRPVWCATGRTSLRPKKTTSLMVDQRIDFVRLGELRLQLDQLCRDALAREAGILDGASDDASEVD